MDEIRSVKIWIVEGRGGGMMQVSLKNKRFGENAEKIEKVDREQVGYIYEMKRSEDLRCYPW
jgi:hypothetical protein